METVIQVLQWVNAIITIAALIFFTGALPYVLGRWVGGKSAEARLVAKALEDKTAFEFWLAKKKINLAGKKIGELSSFLGIR
jgi:hypothetical protein